VAYKGNPTRPSMAVSRTQSPFRGVYSRSGFWPLTRSCRKKISAGISRPKFLWWSTGPKTEFANFEIPPPGTGRKNRPLGDFPTFRETVPTSKRRWEHRSLGLLLGFFHLSYLSYLIDPLWKIRPTCASENGTPRMGGNVPASRARGPKGGIGRIGGKNLTTALGFYVPTFFLR
jgi:hypothetical protein